MSCRARLQYDEYVCTRCGYSWAHNDPDPPDCLTSRQIGEQAIKNLKLMLAYPVTPCHTDPTVNREQARRDEKANTNRN